MSASAMLVIRMLPRLFVDDRTGAALWRQFPAHDSPRADQKSGADNHRRGERGEILQHDPYLSLGARMTGGTPAIRTLPAGAEPSARDLSRGTAGQRGRRPFPRNR